MFKQLKLWSILAVLLSAVACKPKAVETPMTLEVGSSSVSFMSGAEDKELTVRASSDDWTVTMEPAAEWLTYKKATGKLVLSAAENMQTGERSTKVVIALPSSNLKREVTVTQSGVDGSISVAKSEYSFDLNGGTENIPVTVNGTGWTADFVTSVDWITFQVTENSLNVTVKPFETEGSVGRTAQITLSLGDSHALVTIKQSGKQAFPNFLMKPRATRKEVREFISMHKSEFTEVTKTRDLYGQQQSYVSFTKGFAYETTSAAGKYIVYQMATPSGDTFIQSASDNDIVNRIYILSEDIDGGGDKNFAPGVLEDYMSTEGYIKDVDADVWHKSFDDYTVNVKRIKENDNIGNVAWFFKGACIQIDITSNTSEEAGTKTSVFPVRNSAKLRVNGYMLAEATAYEAQFGLQPNPTYKSADDEPFTKISSIAQYPNLYESYCFTVPNVDGAQDGQHVMSVYYQCIPGLKNDRPQNDDGAYPGYEYNWPENLSEPGTIGQRMDVYKGYKKFFNLEESALGAGYETLSLKPSVVSLASAMGYQLVINDSDLGIVYFVRGEDEVVMMQGSLSATQITFLKNKNLVTAARTGALNN